MLDARALIEAYCGRGDQESFRCFYRDQSGRLWKFLIARGCDRDTAYDLLSEAFLRFIQTVCRDPGSPVALLYRIAVNLRIDGYRRERASPVRSMETPPEPVVSAEPEDHLQLRTLVSSLPAGEQNLLLLRYWIGLSHKEVAQALELPEGTVRRQCMQTMEKLRKRWNENG
ncbi:MAG TPA: sigma-70 family RNA polymerase sigma factor [Burkholderiales bacterium]|nr:sigma-70 family RNA polymerase sigma factor [Burkholderiales bacterium]